MFRRSWKFLLLGAVVAGTLATVAPKADAFWWWGCYRPVYWGCASGCTPYATVGYSPYGYSTGSWYLGYRPGPIRRLLFGPYRWYYGGWGSGYATYYQGYGSCYTCSTPVAGQGTVQVQVGAQPTPAASVPTFKAVPTPAKEPTPAVTPAEPSVAPAIETPALPAIETPAVPMIETPALPTIETPAAPPATAPAPADQPGTSTVPTRANSGLLTVWVPYGAKVFVNGLATHSTGSRRQYVSYGLKPGFSYKYTVRAQVVRGGRLIEDVRTVTMTAGQRTAVAFGFNPVPSQGLALIP